MLLEIERAELSVEECVTPPLTLAPRAAPQRLQWLRKAKLSFPQAAQIQSCECCAKQLATIERGFD